jgi:hypothetical protein
MSVVGNIVTYNGIKYESIIDACIALKLNYGTTINQLGWGMSFGNIAKLAELKKKFWIRKKCECNEGDFYMCTCKKCNTKDLIDIYDIHDLEELEEHKCGSRV